MPIAATTSTAATTTPTRRGAAPTATTTATACRTATIATPTATECPTPSSGSVTWRPASGAFNKSQLRRHLTMVGGVNANMGGSPT
ncbi:MAG: hypothetical protein EPO55_12155 [Reyranella sp.]|nr:MAG: hypothetical protein EPO55_12155 [Reyranella sp.]